MAESHRILVVDDDPKIRNLVTSYLRADGYEVVEAGDGEVAVQQVRRGGFALVVLDVVMPILDGLEALRQIRTFSDVHVILLTARAEETDKLIGLAVGADDYLTKPFSPRELVARVKAVLRRVRTGATGPDADPGDVVELGGLRIDRSRSVVEIDGTSVELTALEFDLLATLAAQPGRVFSRRQLLDAVWGWDHVGDDRVVDVHIGNLRKALGESAGTPRFLGTVRGVGYKLLEPGS